LKLKARTLFRTIFLLDRFIATLKQQLRKDLYQCVVCACLSIASKLEEREEDAPSIKLLRSYTADTYSVKQLVEMESLVLNTLDWDLSSCPTPADFVELFAQEALLSSLEKVFHMGTPAYEHMKQVCDEVLAASLVELHVLEQFSPSIIAASAIHATRKMFECQPVWTKELEQITALQEKEVTLCSSVLQSFYEIKQSAGTEQQEQVIVHGLTLGM
jgi:hypothetical protein